MLNLSRKFATREITDLTGYSSRTLSRMIKTGYLVQGKDFEKMSKSIFSRNMFTLDGYFKVLDKKYGTKIRLSGKNGKYVIIVRYYNAEFILDTKIKSNSKNKKYALLEMDKLNNLTGVLGLAYLIESGTLKRTGSSSAFTKNNRIGDLLNYYLIDIKNRYESGIIKKATFERYLRACNFLKRTNLKQKNISNIDKKDINSLILQMSLSYTGKTIRAYIKPLKEISSFLLKAGFISKNLFLGVTYPHYKAPDPELLTKLEKMLLKGLFLSDRSNLRLLLALCLGTRADIEQLRKLDWADINMNDAEITFNNSESNSIYAKNEISIGISLSSELVKYLRHEHKLQNKPSSGLVFTNDYGVLYSRKEISDEFKKCLGILGLKPRNLISLIYSLIADDLNSLKSKEYIKEKFGYRSFFTVNRVKRILQTTKKIKRINEYYRYMLRQVHNTLLLHMIENHHSYRHPCVL